MEHLLLDCIELISECLSISTLAAPSPPPGFEAEIYYDTSKTFNPLGVYLCALDFMYALAQKGWTTILHGGYTVWVNDFDVEIDVESEEGSISSLPLESSHIVLGFYKTIVDVSTQSRFCEVLTTLWQYRRQVGTIVIEKRTLENGGSDIANSSLVNGSPQNNTVTYPSGRVFDKDEHDFSISYTYSGVRINSKDIFLAALDALATAAQFSPDSVFRSLNAISISGDCVINMVENDSSSKLNYSFVTKALRILLVDVMVHLRIFEEITLQLEWRMLKMAEGSIKLANHRTTVQ